MDTDLETGYEAVAELPLVVQGYELERREPSPSADFTRYRTTLALRGAGETGRARTSPN
jgi:hypothetical protein